MDPYQQIIATISLAMGAAWASGINLYATIGVLGYLGLTGSIELPDQLLLLQDPWVIGAAVFMYIVEFFADKTPGIDTAWDAIHSFIRIPAGALLAAGAIGNVNPALLIAAGILGGAVSTTTYAVKAGSRVLINTSPEPLTNWAASFTEDIAVFSGVLTALHYPLLFLFLLILFLVAALWMIPKLWRQIKTLFHKGRSFFRGKEKPIPEKPPQISSP